MKRYFYNTLLFYYAKFSNFFQFVVNIISRRWIGLRYDDQAYMGTGKMWTCGLADRPTGKLRTIPVDQVRSLPTGQSAGPHCLYKTFFPVSDVCIITALDVAYLPPFARYGHV